MNKIIVILLVVLSVALTALCFMLFSPSRKTYEQGKQDAELEHLRKEVPTITADRDRITAKYDSLQSASQQRFNDLETKKQPLIIRYEKIPVTVNNFDREQLRRAISEY